MTDQQESYRINLPQFEGPFDLLLFFIERDELDIHDIPIATITNDFLDYIHHIKILDIELASEFILVAATLMRIKAKMLLPRPVVNEEGEEVDPRDELVRRLLEYKRYKEVLEDLHNMEHEQSERALRGFAKGEEKLFVKEDTTTEEELMGVSLYTIMRTFKRIMERHQAELLQPRHVIRKYKYNIQQVKIEILQRVTKHEKIDFVTLILEEKEKIYAVFCFLAILELTQVQRISLTIGEGHNNFWINRKDPDEEALEMYPDQEVIQDILDDEEE